MVRDIEWNCVTNCPLEIGWAVYAPTPSQQARAETVSSTVKRTLGHALPFHALYHEFRVIVFNIRSTPSNELSPTQVNLRMLIHQTQFYLTYHLLFPTRMVTIREYD